MRSYAPLLWVLTGAVMIAPPIAAADDRTPTPSAKELWQTYPLQPDTETATATPTPTAREQRQSAPSPPAGDGGPLVPLLASAGALLALAGALVMRRRAGHGRSVLSRAPAALTGPALLTAAATASLPEGKRRSPRLFALAEGPSRGDAEPATRAPIRPPDPERAWTVELEWRDEGDGPRFCALAQPDGGRARVAIFSSEPLEWPPADAEAVERLRRTVARMEAVLQASGWTPLPPGPSWYSKRFAWSPVTQRVSPRRFVRQAEWPADTDHLWRCEIRWQAGYVHSRFRAVAHAPERRRGITIGTTKVFKWLFMDDPKPGDAEFRSEVERLDARMKAAGWEAAGRGERWYALRYLWRHDGQPPHELEPALAGTGESTHGGDHGRN